MEPESRHEHIEAYLAGKLDAGQKADFEREMAESEAVRREVELHRMAEVAIRHGSKRWHKARLQEIDRELNVSGAARKNLFRRLAVAASVLVLIAAGAHFYAHGTYAHSAVAERFYAPVQTEVFRGAEQQQSAATLHFQEAQIAFKNGAYDQAIEHYLTIIQENGLQKEQAEWNLLMCYLAKDPDGEQFRVMADHILNDPDHSYHHKSLELQRTMGRALYRFVNK